MANIAVDKALVMVLAELNCKQVHEADAGPDRAVPDILQP